MLILAVSILFRVSAPRLCDDWWTILHIRLFSAVQTRFSFGFHGRETSVWRHVPQSAFHLLYSDKSA